MRQTGCKIDPFKGNGTATVERLDREATDCYSVVARFNSLDALEVID
jgi:hypothetical protein